MNLDTAVEETMHSCNFLFDRHDRTFLFVEVFTQGAGTDDRHSGGGRNPESAVLSFETFWTPACAEVTEPPVVR